MDLATGCWLGIVAVTMLVLYWVLDGIRVQLVRLNVHLRELLSHVVFAVDDPDIDEQEYTPSNGKSKV